MNNDGKMVEEHMFDSVTAWWENRSKEEHALMIGGAVVICVPLAIALSGAILQGGLVVQTAVVTVAVGKAAAKMPT